jgi:hypothetical protein
MIMARKIGMRPSSDVLHDVLVGTPEEFNGAHDSLRGRTGSDSVGRLPDPFGSAYRKARAHGRILFTVYSYATPIAWLEQSTNGAPDHWVMPDASYSATTSAHQSRVREVLSELSNGVPSAYTWTLQGAYGCGWEDLTSEDSYREIMARRREYADNEGGTYRIIKRKNGGK